MDEPNPLPIIQTVFTAMTAADHGPQAIVLQAAVHGWMEGHLSVPGHETRDLPPHPGEMPSPPFPNPDSPRLKEILDDTRERFADDEAEAAAAYAIALAWQSGRDEGKNCPGCGIELASSPVARAMREGRMHIEFRLPETD
ncbi:MAG: hypothetical protein ACRDPC_20390 [Solirubrobacteraceae bacterium]